MRKKLRVLAAVATIVAMAASVGLFAFRLSGLRASGERSAGAEYSILRNAIIPIQSQNDLSEEFLRNRLSALYQGSDRLLAAQVQNSEGLTVWRIPASSTYFANPGDQGAISGFFAPESSTLVFSTPLTGGMKLAALYTTLKRSDISKAALPSLLLSLAWFAAILLATLLLRKDGEEETSGGQTSEEAENGAEISDPARGETSSAAVEEETEAAPPSEAIEGNPDSAVPTEANIDSTRSSPGSAPDEASEDEDLDEVVEELVELEEANEREVEDDTSAEAVAGKKQGSGRNFEESLARLEEEIREWSLKKEAQSLPASAQPPGPPQSPSSGQVLSSDQPPNPAPKAQADQAEEPPAPSAAQTPDERRDLADLPLSLSLQDPALQERLAFELKRGSFDLALLLIHCGLGSEAYPAGDPAAAALAATLRDYVGSKDLVFELYKGGLAVILPSIDLGAALKMSEDLADVLATTLGLYMDIESEAPVYIGISSVARRSVEAGKLYREASTAVHKAFAGGPSKILAFRPKS
ncbi:MAG TPA: hypothetical protein VIO60_05315 [Rectinemataceae bacterium]